MNNIIESYCSEDKTLYMNIYDNETFELNINYDYEMWYGKTSKRINYKGEILKITNEYYQLITNYCDDSTIYLNTFELYKFFDFDNKLQFVLKNFNNNDIRLTKKY